MNVTRWRIVAVVLFAIVFALQPVLHTHRASGEDVALPCAVCATAHSQVPASVPQLDIQLTVICDTIQLSPVVRPFSAPRTLPSRAPPQA